MITLWIIFFFKFLHYLGVSYCDQKYRKQNVLICFFFKGPSGQPCNLLKIYTRLYLAGLMGQHLQNPLCAHSMYVNLYILYAYKEPPSMVHRSIIHFIFSELTVAQKYQ